MLEVRFVGNVEKALAGKLYSWTDSAEGCLVLILLLEQFIRNIYRDTPRAFAGDKKALELSFRCNENSCVTNADIHWCQFMLMPMIDSEEIAVRDASLPLFKKLICNWHRKGTWKENFKMSFP